MNLLTYISYILSKAFAQFNLAENWINGPFWGILGSETFSVRLLDLPLVKILGLDFWYRSSAYFLLEFMPLKLSLLESSCSLGISNWVVSLSSNHDNFSWTKGHNFSSGVDFSVQVFENDYMALFPECFCILCALFLTVYGVYITTSSKHSFPLALNPLAGLTVYTLFFAILLVLNSPFRNGVFLYHSFIVDDAATIFKIVICCAAIAALCISLDSLKRESISSFEYSIIILLSTSSMLFLVSAGDLISMYLAIELQSLCFYVLAAFRRDSEFSTEAGLKYFLLGAFSSGILLFGCCLVYGFTGGVAFSEHAQLFSCGDFSSVNLDKGSNLAPLSQLKEFLPFGQALQGPLDQNFGYVDNSFGLKARGCELGMLFIQIGLLFKLSAVPFHMWAPDVYEGSPTAVTAFFAIVNKASFILIFFRCIFTAFYDLNVQWQISICCCAILSMLVGSFAGLAQQRIKRLLAWSAIAHAGYLLVSLSCDTLEGVVSGVIYMVVYMIVSTSIFGVILAPVRRESASFYNLKYTSDLAYLGRSNPLLAATLTIGLFSLAGIPPLAGFYGKAYLFWAALNSSLYIIAIVGIISSAVSAFYYIRIVKIMYFEAYTYKNLKALGFAQLSKESAIVQGLCFIFNICFCLYPKPLYLAGLQAALCFL